jgi:hypothetical protein
MLNNLGVQVGYPYNKGFFVSDYKVALREEILSPQFNFTDFLS